MGTLSPSLALPFFLQIINFREPVTLDFLDAELEDENKEEVSRPGQGQLLGHSLSPSSAVAKGTQPFQPALLRVLSSGSWHSSHGATVGIGAGSLSPGCQHDESPQAAHPAPHGFPVSPHWDGCPWVHGWALWPSVASSVSHRSGGA